MVRKEASPRPGKVLVTFELPSALWAEYVNLVGDFNGWSTSETPMQQSRQDPTWSITLELDQAREYQFRYLLDGTEWHNDWHADKYVPNGHGSDNSVVST